MYSEDGILLDTGTVGHLASKYNLDDSAICKRRYKSTGKLNGKRLVFRYTHDKFTASDKKQLASNNKGFKSGKIDSVKIVWKYI